MEVLTAERVEKIMRDCLFKAEEVPNGQPPADAVIVDGLVRKFGLNRQRLESHRAEIVEMLGELPDSFFKEKGGGWTFLNLCNDRNQRQWGEHRDMEALCVLAIGLGLGEFLLDRDMWASFPGGVPYVCFSIPAISTQEVHG